MEETTNETVVLKRSLDYIEKIFGSRAEAWWYARVLVLATLLAISDDSNKVRLPVIVAAEADADLISLRKLLRILFGTTHLYSGLTSKKAIEQLFAKTANANGHAIVLLDMMQTTDKIRLQTRDYLLLARDGDGEIARSANNGIESIRLDGSAVCIIPTDAAGPFAGIGIALIMENSGDLHRDDWNDMEEAISTLQAAVTNSQSPASDSSELGMEQYASPLRYRGYAVLAEIAPKITVKYPGERFMEAIRTAWISDCAERRASCSDSVKQQMLAAHILNYVQAHAISPDTAIREDLIAETIRAADPELFAEVTHTDIGKFLSSRGIGKVNPHGRLIVRGNTGTGEAARIWRTCRSFDENAKSMLQRQAGEYATSMGHRPLDEQQLLQALDNGAKECDEIVKILCSYSQREVYAALECAVAQGKLVRYGTEYALAPDENVAK